ncbi:DUF3139 domain-containing protein [Paenibacillus sp. SORGH_AS_0306]|uniref:DUF3139 domain-containing protein n=1 Tax=unclassified Paenibacillus TaxID=185978 RepID=UPI003593559F
MWKIGIISRKATLITSFSILIVIAERVTIYLGLYEYPLNKEKAEEQIKKYLINEKGYTSSEIEEVEGIYSFTSSNSPYGANVVFKD